MKFLLMCPVLESLNPKEHNTCKLEAGNVTSFHKPIEGAEADVQHLGRLVAAYANRRPGTRWAISAEKGLGFDRVHVSAVSRQVSKFLLDLPHQCLP